MIKIIISPSQQNGTEENLVRPIAELLFKKLKYENLVEPVMVPDYSGMSDESALWTAIQFSNAQNANYHLDIHSDGGGYATGCSGLYVSESGKTFITPITQALMDLTPWSDVGIRKRTDLGVLNQTSAIAGLIELSFHDNTEEYTWMKANGDLIAETLKNGVYKALNIEGITNYKIKYELLLNQYYSFRQGVVDLMNKFI